MMERVPFLEMILAHLTGEVSKTVYSTIYDGRPPRFWKQSPHRTPDAWSVEKKAFPPLITLLSVSAKLHTRVPESSGQRMTIPKTLIQEKPSVIGYEVSFCTKVVLLHHFVFKRVLFLNFQRRTTN